MSKPKFLSREVTANPIKFDGIKTQAGLRHLNQIAIHPMKLLTADPRLPRLSGGGGR